MRVMLAVATETERVVAIFHDLVEDTGYTVDDLRRRDARNRLSRRWIA